MLSKIFKSSSVEHEKGRNFNHKNCSNTIFRNLKKSTIFIENLSIKIVYYVKTRVDILDTKF